MLVDTSLMMAMNGGGVNTELIGETTEFQTYRYIDDGQGSRLTDIDGLTCRYYRIMDSVVLAVVNGSCQTQASRGFGYSIMCRPSKLLEGPYLLYGGHYVNQSISNFPLGRDGSAGGTTDLPALYYSGALNEDMTDYAGLTISSTASDKNNLFEATVSASTTFNYDNGTFGGFEISCNPRKEYDCFINWSFNDLVIPFVKANL